MHGFHLTLRTLGVGHIRDTQCGFKVRRSTEVRWTQTNFDPAALYPTRSATPPTAPPHPQLALRCRAPHPRAIPLHPSSRSARRLARSGGLQAPGRERLHWNAQGSRCLESKLRAEEMESSKNEIGVEMCSVSIRLIHACCRAFVMWILDLHCYSLCPLWCRGEMVWSEDRLFSLLQNE